MKTKLVLKSTMVAIVLFLGIALYASSSGVSCQGTVKDQYDSPVEGVWIQSTANSALRDKTDMDGHYSLSGLQQNSTVEVVVPSGFSAMGSTISQPLSQQSNVADFTLFDESY